MPSAKDLRAALSICAAVIGAGFASGREIVSFFSCFGVASWLGVMAAGAAIGLLTGIILTLASRTGARSFPDLYGALMGTPCRDAMHMLSGLLCLITASAMLAAGAELGALAFDLPHAHMLGLLITLAAGLASAHSGMRPLSALGALLVPALTVYFIIVGFINSVPTPVFSVPLILQSLPMGLLYATFNVALAGGAVCLNGSGGVSPRHTACLTALMLTVLLSLGNRAMLYAQPATREMALPTVFLSSLWGIPGYYISLFILWLAVLTTLSAMLSSLRAQLETLGLGRKYALPLAGLAASFLAVCGFQALVNVAYPILGWICGFALLALILFI